MPLVSADQIMHYVDLVLPWPVVYPLTNLIEDGTCVRPNILGPIPYTSLLRTMYPLSSMMAPTKTIHFEASTLSPQSAQPCRLLQVDCGDDQGDEG